MNHRGWSRTERADGRTNSGQAMLTTVRCAPHKLRLIMHRFSITALQKGFTLMLWQSQDGSPVDGQIICTS